MARGTNTPRDPDAPAEESENASPSSLLDQGPANFVPQDESTEEDSNFPNPPDNVVDNSSPNVDFVITPTLLQVLPKSQVIEDRDERIRAAIREQGLELPKGAPQVSADQYLAIQAAQVRAAAVASQLDKTVPGGRYLVAGVWVDANGNRLEE